MRVLHVVLSLLRSLARELSDENAYRRYLAQSGKSHSHAEWKTFTRQRYGRKYGTPKCC